MKYAEELLWILDEPGGPARTLESQNIKFQIRKSFVHSLGLKCDYVGWCKMDLANPRTPDILSSICSFCKENGWRARGLYTRRYVDVQSDWYELIPIDFKDNTPCDRIETVTEDGRIVYTRVIRAFHELTPTPKAWGEEIFVPERFRDFCIKNYFNDLDFCWVRDKGKYDAEQYFHVYGKCLIPKIAVDYDLTKSNIEFIAAAGGWLPEVADAFHELQQINLPDCYLLDDLPEGGIIYAYIPSTCSRVGRHVILLHKEIVQSILQQKILPSSSFRPVPVVKTLPGGYSLYKTQHIDRPTSQFMDMMFEEYMMVKNTPRPLRIVSEKDALKLLRLVKKERKEGFQKGLSKDKSQALLKSDYNALIPYYSIADGCFLSDEFELLSSVQAMKRNEEFQLVLTNEELLDTKPEGVVIARCSDGDSILLCNSGEVVRVSHEGPGITEQWSTLAQFFVDAIND